MPLACQDFVAWPFIAAFSLLFAQDKVSGKSLAVRELFKSLAVFEIFLPIAFVEIAVHVLKFTISVCFISFKVANVNVSIIIVESAVPVGKSILPLSLVAGAIRPYLLALPVPNETPTGILLHLTRVEYAVSVKFWRRIDIHIKYVDWVCELDFINYILFQYLVAVLLLTFEHNVGGSKIVIIIAHGPV